MKKIYTLKLFAVSLVFGAQSFAFSQTLVHYWNFNNNSTIATITTPTQSLFSGAALVAVPGGSSVIDNAGGTGQNFNVENLKDCAANITNTFSVFPNPASKGTVYFNREADIEIYDMAGKLLQKAAKQKTIDTSRFATGLYIIKTSEGIVKRLIVK